MNSKFCVFNFFLFLVFLPELGFSQSSKLKKAISKELDGIILSVDSSSNLVFYEGQLIEMAFRITNNTSASKRFIFDSPELIKVKDQYGNIMELPKGIDTSLYIGNKSDFFKYHEAGAMLKIDAFQSVNVYKNEEFVSFFGNRDLSDFIKMTPDEKKKFTGKLPRFLKPGKYLLTYLFYVLPFNKCIEMEIPIQVYSVSGEIKKQQNDFMNLLWVSLKSDYYLSSESFDSIPIVIALKKDTNTIYASDYIHLINLSFKCNPFRSDINLYNFLDLISKLTCFRSPNALVQFFYWRGDCILAFQNSNLIYDMWSYMAEYSKKSKLIPLEAFNALLDRILYRMKMAVGDIETLYRKVEK